MCKNILFIAYYFPPLGGSGVQRSLKFVKYLPLKGYNPIVVTVKEGHNFAYDEKLLNEVPKGTKVYRSNSGETLWIRNIIESTNKSLGKIKSNIRNERNQSAKENSNVNSINSEGIKDKVFRYLEYNYYVPDTKIRWYKNAVKNIENVILKENDIEAIFSTSAPYTDHLIALAIKKLTNKPWIADFRDPWVGNAFIYDRYDENRKEKERKLEREVVKYADKVINVTELSTIEYKKRYPEYEHKFVTITNGFDIKDKVDEPVSKDKFIVNYSGVLTAGQSPESMINALKNICDKNSGFKNDLLFRFTGSIVPEYELILKNSPIANNIEINSYVSHDVILKQMKSAAINYIILADKKESESVFAGKMFDYMLSERPIIGVMPLNGVSANLIKEKNIGKCFDHSDVDNLQKYIEEVYINWKNGNDLNTNAISKCEEFERKNLTAKLVEVIESIGK